jgi:hypothetical protein
MYFYKDVTQNPLRRGIPLSPSSRIRVRTINIELYDLRPCSCLFFIRIQDDFFHVERPAFSPYRVGAVQIDNFLEIIFFTRSATVFKLRFCQTMFIITSHTSF